jgi:hypothetical protein
MKTNLIFLLTCLFLVPFQLKAQNNQDKILGFGSTGADVGYCVTTTENNIFLGGWFSNTVHFGQFTLTSEGGTDIFILQITEEGEVLWAKGFGGPFDDYIVDMKNDFNNTIYFTGSYGGMAYFGNKFLNGFGFSDTYLCSITFDGEVNWVLDGGGMGEDRAYRLSINPENNYVVFTGYYRSVAQFGTFTLPFSGTRSAFWAKVDTSGQYEWVISSGNDESDQSGYGVAIDSDNNIYIAGYFFSNTWQVGTIDLINSGYGSSDISLIKMDPLGNIIDAWAMGGPYDDLPRPLYYNNQSLYLGGYHYGEGDFLGLQLSGNGDFIRDSFVLKTNLLGEAIWGASQFSNDENELIGMYISNDNLWVTGGFMGTLNSINEPISIGGYDAFSLSIDEINGHFENATIVQSKGHDIFYGVSMQNDKNISIGYFSQIAIYEDTSIISKGGTDIVALLSSQINPAPSPLGINQVYDSKTIQIYPNPVVSTCQIKQPNAENLITEIQIYDLMGNLVVSQQVNNTSAETCIDCTVLASGFYILKAIYQDGSFSGGKLKKH